MLISHRSEPSHPENSWESLVLCTEDGQDLAATYFPALAIPPAGVVVVNAATGVSRHYYRRFGAFIARQGYATLSYDYRGVGDSRPRNLRGFSADFLDWGQRDFSAVLDYVVMRWPKTPIFVVGHSIGGTLLGMARNYGVVRAAVTVGAQTAYFRDWPWPQRWYLYALWHGLLPALTRVWGYFPGRRLGILEDLPAGIIRQWHARRLYPGYLRQLRKETDQLFYDQISFPIFAIGLSDDPIGSPQAIDRLHRLFSRANVQRRTLTPQEAGVPRIGHFGFFRPVVGDRLWVGVLDWLSRVDPG